MEENLETTKPVGAGQGGDVDAQPESLNAETHADAERPAGEGGQKQEDALHKKDTQSRAENTAFKRMRQRIRLNGKTPPGASSRPGQQMLPRRRRMRPTLHLHRPMRSCGRH